jgi:hypothetical protein
MNKNFKCNSDHRCKPKKEELNSKGFTIWNEEAKNKKKERNSSTGGITQ